MSLLLDVGDMLFIIGSISLACASVVSVSAFVAIWQTSFLCVQHCFHFPSLLDSYYPLLLGSATFAFLIHPCFLIFTPLCSSFSRCPALFLTCGWFVPSEGWTNIVFLTVTSQPVPRSVLASSLLWRILLLFDFCPSVCCTPHVWWLHVASRLFLQKPVLEFFLSVWFALVWLWFAYNIGFSALVLRLLSSAVSDTLWPF